MRYQIVAVGQLKRNYYTHACQAYLKRLKPYAKTEVLEVKEQKAKRSASVKDLESKALLSVAKGHLISLDEKGQAFTSKELAQEITRLENQGTSLISILIGGADGHSDLLKDAVAASWRLSTFTLPHELARLVLLEQLYRVETLKAGHPYHRD